MKRDKLLAVIFHFSVVLLAITGLYLDYNIETNSAFHSQALTTRDQVRGLIEFFMYAIFLISLVSFLVGLILLFFKNEEIKRIRKALLMNFFILLVITVSWYFIGSYLDKNKVDELDVSPLIKSKIKIE